MEDAAQLLQGSRSQTARLGIGEEDAYSFLHSWHLCWLQVLSTESGVLVFAGEEFCLFPGLRFRRGSKAPGTTGKSTVKPLGTAAAAIGGIIFLRTIGVMAGVDRQHNAVNLARKLGWYNSGTFSVLSIFPQFKYMFLKYLRMVEAAGVEPASEIDVSQETPCSVQFRRIHFEHSERTRCTRS
jgi:hypothetical protein